MKVLQTETPQEEIANAVTHGIGAFLSVIGLIALLFRNEAPLSWIELTSYSLFGGSMILLYVASTLYHAFFRNPKLYRFFRLVDHSAIYVLIAGSYTPFTLVAIKGEEGVMMFFVMWTLAVLGVVFKMLFIGKYKRLSLIMYITMGFLGMGYYQDLIQALNQEGFNLMLLGGLLYMIGVIFFIWEKLPFNHAIWHLFVMGGSAAMYFCIYFYVF